MTLQNGVPFWYVREPPLKSVDATGTIGRLFGDEQVIGGVVHVSGEVTAPGRVRQSGGLRYVLGTPTRGDARTAQSLVDVFRSAGLGAEYDDDIRATVWLKLVNNAALNSLSVLRRLTIKPMLADPALRAEARSLMVEALRVGQAMNVVRAVDVDARIDYAARLDDVKTSTLQDFERGRPLEAEPMLGALIELAERYHVEVPRLKGAYVAIRHRAAAGTVR
ncbi:MAG: hypothetical protein JO030_04705 [Candidatus Eremiobacteraeota bacterium]|nr:hypothetical protein [Candidatus Eremiobacteraeota bacterium]